MRNHLQISYRKSGSGPPLVLIHGSFSDHWTNWEFVFPLLDPHFTCIAVARRGRGQTEAMQGHTMDDEVLDVVSLLDHLAEPVFLLGHSFGAHIALRAAQARPEAIRGLILYEPPHPAALDQHWPELERLATVADWDRFSWTFFHQALAVPVEEIERMRSAGLWEPIVRLAEASLGDLRALRGTTFEPDRYRDLRVPTLLQVGSESPSHLFVTQALAASLPCAEVETLEGQAHEAMTTGPVGYAASLLRFCNTV